MDPELDPDQNISVKREFPATGSSPFPEDITENIRNRESREIKIQQK